MDLKCRAVELREKMSLEEKVAQMLQISYSRVSHKEALIFAKMGAGSFLHVMGDDARAIQEEALKSRLKIPVIFGIDAIHGHALNSSSTVFPSPLAMAASFDRNLVKSVARATAREVSEDALHWTFSPLLCIGRDLRWGRISETFGEDPFLIGEMAKVMIEGYQNDGDLKEDNGILACAKHFIAYGESTGGRDSYDSPVPERQLRSLFLPPFQKAIDAGVGSIMAGYQSVDLLPCSANPYLLKDILQKEMGFEGFVVTDWENVRSLIGKQFVAKDIYEASYKAIKSGNHMIMNTPEFYNATLDLVKSGLVEESLIDEAVDRILKIKFDLGLFDNSNKVQTLKNKNNKTKGYIGSKAHEKLNEEITKRAMVLLKNDGILPLFKDEKAPKRIALIGPNADDVMNMLGDWTYFTHPEPKPSNTPKTKVVTLKEGLESLREKYDFDLYYEKVCSTSDLEAAGLKKAIRYAQTCDLVILALGDGLEEYGEEKDRASLELSLGQKAILEAMVEVGTPIVTVLVSSKPLDVYDLAKFSSAMIYGFNWGSLGGEICAKILAGEINPSAKLPISFPRHTGQLPIYYNYLPGWHGGKYVDFHQSQLFEFGHGLSYSKVIYGNLSYSLNFKAQFDEDDPIERLKRSIKTLPNEEYLKGKAIKLSFTLENISDIDCEEVILVYVKDEISSVITPVKELKAFERVSLRAKEKKEVNIEILLEQLCIIDGNYNKVFENGDFTFIINDMQLKLSL
ncbi:MAG: glycoside hydrolase family 3 N-terminal domain-containing protein [Filifactoraceae bacterium]